MVLGCCRGKSKAALTNAHEYCWGTLNVSLLACSSLTLWGFSWYWVGQKFVHVFLYDFGGKIQMNLSANPTLVLTWNISWPHSLLSWTLGDKGSKLQDEPQPRNFLWVTDKPTLPVACSHQDESGRTQGTFIYQTTVAQTWFQMSNSPSELTSYSWDPVKKETWAWHRSGLSISSICSYNSWEREVIRSRGAGGEPCFQPRPWNYCWKLLQNNKLQLGTLKSDPESSPFFYFERPNYQN